MSDPIFVVKPGGLAAGLNSRMSGFLLPILLAEMKLRFDDYPCPLSQVKAILEFLLWASPRIGLVVTS